MNWLRELARRLNMLLNRRQFDADLEEEIRLHLDMRQREQLASGMTSREAAAAARRRFGNPTILREKSHSAWGWEWLEHFLQDINYGIRAMLRSPGITLVALFSLALGIGANTAIFSLTDAVLLKSLPVNDPAQLVLFGNGLDEGISDGFPNRWLFSYPFYREMQKRNHVFSDVAAAFSMTDRVHGFVQGRRDSEPMSVQLVSGTYFPLLGVQAMLGRALSEDDDRTQGGHPVTMVSYPWWTQNLARDPSVLTKKLIIGSTSFSIVGVAPPEFFGTKVGEAPDIWIPLSMQKEVPPGFDGYNDNMFESLHLMARLKRGVTVPEATANVNLLYPQILRGFSGAPLTQENLQKLDKTRVELNSLATGFSRLRYQFYEPLEILMAVVGLVLLVACANIANLLLARSTARTRELAVREALGAGRSRLIRQLLTESLVLALAGGALGVVFASAASHLLLRMVSDGRIPLHLNVPLDLRLLLFTLCVTLCTAVLFGTIPAFRATRVNLTDLLKDGRSQSSAAPTRGPLTKVLVVSQVALSLVLLVDAGLFVRSLLNLTNVDTGFNKENVLRLRLDPSSAGYLEDTRLFNIYQQIEQRVSTLPGVRAASFSIFAFNEGTWNNSIWVQGYLAGHRETDVHHNAVGNGYFAAMGIPLLAGRAFGPQDSATSPKVGIIGETTARTMFPAGSPIGQHYGRSPQNAGDIEVIGVAKDVKYNSLDEPPQPGDYLPYSQNVRYLNDFEVRYAGDSVAMITAIRQSIHDVDSSLPISDVITLHEQVARSVTKQRLVAQLSSFFGVLALFLSCIGIYGLISYIVSRRTNEIGVRMALGAARSQVLWMVMRESLWLVTLGILIGVPVALASERLVSTMLFGLRPNDPLTLLAGVAMLLAVATLAGYLPARRASRVDPMIALRYE
jgi:predicted permease